MKPEKVFEFFKQINAVPRPSKKEEKMMAYLSLFYIIKMGS